MNETESPRIGSPDQWSAFLRRNQVFCEERPVLEQAISGVFSRNMKDTDLFDRYIYFAGAQVVDDLMEIFTLCANSEAYGALKLLRPMFEHVVTLLHLHGNSDEFEAFWEYYAVDQHKVIVSIRDTLGADAVSGPEVEMIEATYKRVRSRYEVPECKTCGTTRPGGSWSRTDIVTMAKNVGLGVFVFPAYYEPLQHSHPKVHALIERLDETAEGTLRRKERLNPALADRVLCVAHGLLIKSLGVQIEHFDLDRASLDQAEAHFGRCWVGRDAVGGEDAGRSGASGARS